MAPLSAFFFFSFSVVAYGNVVVVSVLFFGFLAQSVGRGERRKGESGNLEKEQGDTRRVHILGKKAFLKGICPIF